MRLFGILSQLNERQRERGSEFNNKNSNAKHWAFLEDQSSARATARASNPKFSFPLLASTIAHAEVAHYSLISKTLQQHCDSTREVRVGGQKSSKRGAIVCQTTSMK